MGQFAVRFVVGSLTGRSIDQLHFGFGPEGRRGGQLTKPPVGRSSCGECKPLRSQCTAAQDGEPERVRVAKKGNGKLLKSFSGTHGGGYTRVFHTWFLDRLYIVDVCGLCGPGDPQTPSNK